MNLYLFYPIVEVTREDGEKNKLICIFEMRVFCCCASI